jgi:hypothetical protein
VDLFPTLGVAQGFQQLLTVARRLAVFESDMVLARTAGATAVAALLSPARATMARHLTALQNDGLQRVLETAQRSTAPRTVGLSALSLLEHTSPHWERLHRLATHANVALYPADYNPNCGRGVRMRPADQAPPLTLAAHFLKLHAKGNVLIFPRDVFTAYCSRHHRPWNLIVSGLAAKDTPLMRLVSDPFMLNDPVLKPAYAAMWGPLLPPQLADICELVMNARHAFPGVALVAGRADVAAAYNRILNPLADICHQCFLFHLDGRDHVALPVVRTFGIQASNYEFGAVTEFLKARSLARLSAVSPKPLSTFATDDAIIVGPVPIVHEEMSCVAADFVQVCGTGSHAVEKDLEGSAIPIIGYHFDLRCAPGMASLTEKAMARLLCLFWDIVPRDVRAGQPVSNLLLQRLGSYAIRYSHCVIALLPFSRGFSSTLFRPQSEQMACWSLRAIHDLWMWRVVLLCAVGNTTWLRVPVTYPLLLRRLSPMETDPERAARQAAAADYVIHGDARMAGNRGAGMIATSASGTPLVWMQMLLHEFTHYMSASGVLDEMNINVMEFAQAAVSVLAFISWARQEGVELTGRHIHVFTDNSSAHSYIRRNRASHPFHLVLLQVMALVMAQHGILLTIGHIAGCRNVIADAISREFDVPDGEAIRLALLPVPRLKLAAQALHFLNEVARTPFLMPLPTVRLSLTVLDTVIGAVSV